MVVITCRCQAGDQHWRGFQGDRGVDTQATNIGGGITEKLKTEECHCSPSMPPLQPLQVFSTCDITGRNGAMEGTQNGAKRQSRSIFNPAPKYR
ncbi:MAG: hypothetical protein HRU41_20930 [Saprospiraceae bacterium]|nr:hypothetical protein [Saprospiraceae bacterium]